MPSKMDRKSEQSAAAGRAFREAMDNSASTRWAAICECLRQLSGPGNLGGPNDHSSGLPEKPPAEWEVEVTVNQHGTRFNLRGQS